MHAYILLYTQIIIEKSLFKRPKLFDEKMSKGAVCCAHTSTRFYKEINNFGAAEQDVSFLYIIYIYNSIFDSVILCCGECVKWCVCVSVYFINNIFISKEKL